MNMSKLVFILLSLPSSSLRLAALNYLSHTVTPMPASLHVYDMQCKISCSKSNPKLNLTHCQQELSDLD